MNFLQNSSIPFLQKYLYLFQKCFMFLSQPNYIAMIIDCQYSFPYILGFSHLLFFKNPGIGDLLSVEASS